MGIKFSNFGKAVISSAPTGTTGLSFTVEAGKGLLFPALGTGDYFYGIFKDASGNREVVKVDARSTDAMTIATGGRGIDGTTARTWAAGDSFVAGISNIAMQELFNANWMAIGTLTSAADKLPYFTGAGTADVTTFTPAARTILDDADVGAMLTTLGFSAYIKTLINDADAATARATLGVSYGPAFSATGAGPQTLTTNVAAKVTLGTEDFDTNTNFASSRFTPTVAGYYQIDFSTNILGATVVNVYGSIYKNGIQTFRGNQYQGPAITVFGASGSYVVYLNGTTDYLELYAYAEGTTLTVGTSKFSGFFVRPI